MRPAFGVDIAIIQANQVLLIQRSDMPVWGLPGGAVDASESITQAAMFYTRLRQGDLPMTEVINHMCRIPETSDEILELSSTSI